MDDKTLLRVDSLLKHIDKVLDDTSGLSVDELKNYDLLLRATCFSIAQIGEIMNQLEKTIGEKYPKLPWVPARRMRNVIVHDYGGTDVEQVYSTIHNDLSSLKESFLIIRNDLIKETTASDKFAGKN